MPPEKPRPEQREESQGVNLRVAELPPGEKFVIGFDGKTERECFVYNAALRSVLEDKKIDFFRYTGEANTPGPHSWQIASGVARDQIEALLPEVETIAQKWSNGLEEAGYKEKADESKNENRQF